MKRQNMAGQKRKVVGENAAYLIVRLSIQKLPTRDLRGLNNALTKPL